MTTDNPDILFIDLDGTLLNSAKQVSESNLHCLHRLRKQGIIQVIATGRSYYSFRQVIEHDFPADFLIFSSGAGIFDLKTKKLIYTRNLNTKDIVIIVQKLIEHELDFTVHTQVPDNHRFIYYHTNSNNKDFSRRLAIYSEYAEPFSGVGNLPNSSAQIIAVLPHDLDRFTSIADEFDAYQVTRTTSPLDGISMWMEIYPDNVSKGSAAKWLCERLQLDIDETFSIGNDYNDIDMLEFTRLSYVVANAPLDLQKRYTTTRSNDEDGLFHALQDLIGPF